MDHSNIEDEKKEKRKEFEVENDEVRKIRKWIGRKEGREEGRRG